MGSIDKFSFTENDELSHLSTTPHERMFMSSFSGSEESIQENSSPIPEKYSLVRDQFSQNTEVNNHYTQNQNGHDEDILQSGIHDSDLREISIVNNLQPIDTTDSDDDEIIMTVFWRNQKFGAAYYNIPTSELFIMNEITDLKPEHEMLRNLYRQTKPSIVITDSRGQESFIKCLKEIISNVDPTTAADSESISSEKSKSQLNFIPSKEYNFETCKRRIFQLVLPNEPSDSSDADHQNFLHSIINFCYTQTVHALGALLKYIDKNWCRINMGESAPPSFLSLNTVSLHKILNMDDECYKALQVFNRLSHPSNFKKGTAHSAKEGLSIFGIFNKCHSKVGMRHLRAMLQHPTNDIAVLEGRLNTIAFCNQAGNEDVIKNICTCLRHIKNVNGIMTRIKGLRASPYEWKSLFNTLCNGVLICELCEKHQGHSPLIDSLGSRNNHDLFKVAHHMNRVIDFEVSKVQGKFTVKLGVDPELDHKKQTMLGLHGLMSSVAKQELEKLPQFIEECTVVYLPNLGYLLGVKAWGTDLSKEEKALPNLRFMFQNLDYIHYKSQGCEELDNVIGDTHPEILAHEMRIMMGLAKFISEHLHSLSCVMKLCAELDCLISIAKTCKDNDYRRPTLTFEKIIDIKEGRHPLQELCIENFVPNSTISKPGGSLVKILTSPNASGKSIYLKQVALIVYMAHIGSFVPADSATIGMFKNLYTRLQTIENISTRMSAFLIDLRQISLALQGSTSSSLVIIDEFGKGTSDIDGLSLLASCINHFLYRGDKSPHVFVSTHFHCLSKYVISSPLLKLQTLEHLIQDNELVFLYKLSEGVTESSCAFQVAETVGIDASIVNKAKDVFKYLPNTIPLRDDNLSKVTVQKNYIKHMKMILLNENISFEAINKLK